ncbi:F-box/LRR-repeat protein, partial [Trifolium pratense]
MTSSSRRPIPTIDRISDLPDSILSHILSFLPTKQASATSILSKRWKLVWHSVLTLNFDQNKDTFKNCFHFEEFIYFTISSLRENSIRSFTFKCSGDSNFNQRFYNQILKFVMRGVESLEFDMSARSRIIKLPSNILNMKTLRVLKLANIKLGDFDQVDFPLVKTLHLDRISFISTNYIEKFLLGFPILENLYSQSSVSKKSPVPMEDVNALPNLLKVRICDLNIPMDLVCKAKFLDIEKIKISWTRLPMFYNLTYMKFSVHDAFCGNRCTCCMLLGILPYLPKLQHFIIQEAVTQIYSGVEDCVHCLMLTMK